MKPTNKLAILTVFTASWILLWMTGPETPGRKYEPWEFAIFAAVLVICFIQAVRYWSQQIQEQHAERLKKVLKRRDARPNR